MTTVPGPTVRDLELMQERLDAADARIDHLNRLVSTTEAERNRYRERANRRELAYVAVREITALIESAGDAELRAAIAAVVADIPPAPVPAGAARHPERERVARYLERAAIRYARTGMPAALVAAKTLDAAADWCRDEAIWADFGSPVPGQCGACWACRASELDDPMAAAIRALLDWRTVAASRTALAPADRELFAAALTLLRSPTCVDPAAPVPAAPKQDTEPAAPHRPVPPAAAMDVSDSSDRRDRLMAAIRRAPRLSHHRPAR